MHSCCNVHEVEGALILSFSKYSYVLLTSLGNGVAISSLLPVAAGRIGSVSPCSSSGCEAELCMVCLVGFAGLKKACCSSHLWACYLGKFVMCRWHGSILVCGIEKCWTLASCTDGTGGGVYVVHAPRQMQLFVVL